MEHDAIPSGQIVGGDIPMTSPIYTEQDGTSGSEQQEPHATLPTEHLYVQNSTKADYYAADELRRLSLSPALSGRQSPVPPGPYNPLQRRSSLDTPSSPLKRFWLRNKPAILVAMSQLFASVMNLNARLLELKGDGMHPIQVLLIRQVLTSACCFAYMWWMRTPDFPFGSKSIRWLLIFRGMSGFWGVFGMWYSMMYLPLADATVITFLAPGVAGFLCYFVLRAPFTRTEQLATVVALVGVVLIAQPAALFGKSSSPEADSSAGDPSGVGGNTLPGLDHETTPEERLMAVGVALTGVLGASGAFTSIRAIGKRAHPLISVNYLAMACNLICVVALVFAPMLDISQPSLKWVSPVSAEQWLLILSLGLMGFIMQYLLTAGLAADKSNKANAMVYTHMLFAVAFDRWVFGNRMGVASFAGCFLILGSAVGVVLMKKSPAGQGEPKDDVERQQNLSGRAEGSPMLSVGGNTEMINFDGRQ